MANIKFKGNPAHTSGELPKVGAKAPSFKLAKNDLSEASLETYSGKTKVLNIFPSIDTATCAMSVRKFNVEAAKAPNTVVLNISMDLPFAQKRFCGAEGITNAETLSAFRSSFGKDYGLVMTDTPLAGLFSRAVVVLSADDQVLYTEQVAEIASEPNWLFIKTRGMSGCVRIELLTLNFNERTTHARAAVYRPYPRDSN